MKENYFFVFQKREREKKGPSSQRGAHTECNHSSKKKKRKKKKLRLRRATAKSNIISVYIKTSP